MADERPDARTLAAYFFQNTAPMRDVLEEFNRQIHALNTTGHRARALRESFERAVAWVRSLAKLDQESDVQARYAALKALSEIATDLALLHHDKTDGGALKLLAYERSQKLHSAHKYKRYLEYRKREPDDAYKSLLEFAEQHGDEIKAERQTLWNRSDNPPTWTGKGIEEDVRVADNNRCECWAGLSSSLEELYAERNAQMNWGAHGSGAALFRGLDDLHGANATALRDALWAADVCLHIMSHEFPEAFNQPTVRARVERLVVHLKKDPI